jgi:uncharacterized membrane protein YphA (DoxX/SURF4 family)
MKLISRLNWIEKKHHPNWLILLRVPLGLLLLFRGIQFIKNKATLGLIFSNTNELEKLDWMQVAIPWIHLLGGLFITMGILTRLSVLFQIPILAGAILFVNTGHHMLTGVSELYFSILILILLIVFLIEGDGNFSWKKILNKEKDGK